MRALKSYGIAVLLILIVGAWLVTGLFVKGGLGPEKGEVTVVSLIEKDGGPITEAVQRSGIAKTEHHEEGADDPAISIAQRNDLNTRTDGQIRSVRVETFNIKPMVLEITLRGHTAAKGSVFAVARTSDVVETIVVTEGQKVEKGDLICTLAAGTRQASVDQAKAALAQAEAALAKAKADFNTNYNLRQKGLASVNSAEAFAAGLSAAEAGLEAAQVSLRIAQKELDNTEIRAGISGMIQRPLADVGDLLNNGGSCASIIQLDPMVFVGSIPQARVNLAKLGITAQIKTINDQTAEGKVSFIAVSADPSTRTFSVEIEFPNPDTNIFDGLTAEAKVQMGNIPAHLLPQSVLILNGDGILGVQTVKDGKVVFYPVEILDDTRDGIWVTGLPTSVDIIILGQEYVKAGQTVNAGRAE